MIAAAFMAAGLTSSIAAEKLPRLTPLKARDIRGTAHTLPEPKSRTTVLIFIAHDCPISNSYAPEINRHDRLFPLGPMIAVVGKFPR